MNTTGGTIDTQLRKLHDTYMSDLFVGVLQYVTVKEKS